MPIENVAFDLYDEAGNSVGSGRTDSKGELTFNDLKVNQKYTLKEEAVDGFVPLEPWVIELTAADAEKVIEKPVENIPLKGSVYFKKINDWQRAVQGAEFTLTDTADGSIFAPVTAISDETGMVLFENIPYGVYKITETKPAPNHELSDEVLTAVIGSSGVMVSLTDSKGESLMGESGKDFVNISDKALVTIKKVDKNTKKALAGVEFVIYDSTGTERGRGKTGEDGVLKFDNLMVNEKYVIKEVEPLRGYRDSADVSIDILEKKDYEIVWENEKIPDEDEGGGGGTPEKPDEPDKPPVEPEKPDEPDKRPDKPEDSDEPDDSDGGNEPSQPDEPEAPEVPENSEGTVVHGDDDVYYLIDENEVPLAYFDPETDEWVTIEDDEVPLAHFDAPDPDKPDTGDRTDMAKWFAVMAFGLAGIVVLMLGKSIKSK